MSTNEENSEFVECAICIFCPDDTCADCSRNGFYMQVLIPNPEEIIENLQNCMQTH